MPSHEIVLINISMMFCLCFSSEKLIKGTRRLTETVFPIGAWPIISGMWKSRGQLGQWSSPLFSGDFSLQRNFEKWIFCSRFPIRNRSFSLNLGNSYLTNDLLESNQTKCLFWSIARNFLCHDQEEHMSFQLKLGSLAQHSTNFWFKEEKTGRTLRIYQLSINSRIKFDIVRW